MLKLQTPAPAAFVQGAFVSDNSEFVGALPAISDLGGEAESHRPPEDQRRPDSDPECYFGISKALAVHGQKHIWDNISGDALACLQGCANYRET